MKFFLASSAHQLSASSYGVGSASPLLCAPILSPCLTRRSSRPAYGGRLTLHVSQSTGESVFRILLIALLAFGAWKGYEKYQSQRTAQQFQGISQEIDISSGSSRRNRSIDVTPKFQCDGRTHCSQMTSCEEATFFLKNCPGTKMDGNNDGVPCEQQWCK